MNIQLLHQIGSVSRHGVGANGKHAGDFTVVHSFGDQVQHFSLARRQIGILKRESTQCAVIAQLADKFFTVKIRVVADGGLDFD